MAFTCPVCRGTNWTTVVVGRPDGSSRYRTEFRECCSCSAVFMNPERFSAGRDEAAKKALQEKMEKPR